MKNKPYDLEDIIAFLNARLRLSRSERCELSEACISDLRQLTKFKKIQRGEIVLQPKQIHRELYFITKGLLHCYSYNGKMKLVSDWFFWELHLATGIGSFYQGRPSEQYIEAYKHTEVYYLTRDGYEYLCNTYEEFNSVARMLLQDYLVIIHGHGRVLQAGDADQRYKWVLNHLPEVLMHVPLKLVASWLSMNQSTLSRRRKQR